jgi:hypothetical protein
MRHCSGTGPRTGSRQTVPEAPHCGPWCLHPRRDNAAVLYLYSASGIAASVRGTLVAAASLDRRSSCCIRTCCFGERRAWTLLRKKQNGRPDKRQRSCIQGSLIRSINHRPREKRNLATGTEHCVDVPGYRQRNRFSRERRFVPAAVVEPFETPQQDMQVRL